MNSSHIVILRSRSDDGHRQEWTVLFRRILEASGLTVSFEKPRLGLMQIRHVLVSLMIEDHSFSFFGFAIARWMLGLRTVGFLFIPLPCLSPTTARHRLKRIALRLLHVLPNVEVLTILPTSIDSRMGKIASGGIYDPQFWDLPYSGDLSLSMTPLSESIIKEANGRIVVSAMGGQNFSKGFGKFVEIWTASDSIRGKFLFVAAGKVDLTMANAAAAFAQAGGIVINRQLSLEEMLSVYLNSALIWACYAPSYDQSSGILGRAFQTGALAIVRKTSLMDRLCETIAYPVIRLNWGAAHIMANELLAFQAFPRFSDAKEIATGLRNLSFQRLSRAIGQSLTTIQD